MSGLEIERKFLVKKGDAYQIGPAYFLTILMKWGKKTVKYEIKKIIVKPVNRIVLFITTMIVIVFAWLMFIITIMFIKPPHKS